MKERSSAFRRGLSTLLDGGLEDEREFDVHGATGGRPEMQTPDASLQAALHVRILE